MGEFQAAGRVFFNGTNMPAAADKKRMGKMKITADEVLHVAELARLKIDENDLERFADQLGSILEYVESLKKVDTAGVPPTAHAVLTRNAFRPDEEHRSIERELALENAPDTENGFFVVPKIIE